MNAARWLAPLLALAALPGCYSVGFEPVGGLETLAVPVFENRTLRRDLEVDFTRHVRRELLETTPLHLAPEGGLGQAVLRGSIAAVRESVLVAGPAEEVLEAGVQVTVTFGVWRDGRLIVGDDVDADGSPDGEIALEGFAEFSLFRGETREAATDEALRDLAEMVVAHLVERQDDRWEPNDEPAQAIPLPLGRQFALRQRDPDWFRVVVPAGKTLEATLDHRGEPDLVLRAAGPDGQWVPDAQMVDGSRLVRVPALEGERTVLLRVTGPDDGRPYQLGLRLR